MASCAAEHAEKIAAIYLCNPRMRTATMARRIETSDFGNYQIPRERVVAPVSVREAE